jgi:outer membrane receptor protein involved in Fe transport
MLEGIEVIKAITPDMDADAVAGSINLQSRRPTRTQFDGRIEGGSHSLAGGSTYRGGLNYAGVSGPLAYTLGGDFASQVRMTQNTQYTWGNWQGEQVLNRLLLQQYPIERTRYSINGSTNYWLDDRSSLFVRGFYSRYDTEEERHRLRYRLDAGTRTSPTSATGWRTEREARRYRGSGRSGTSRRGAITPWPAGSASTTSAPCPRAVAPSPTGSTSTSGRPGWTGRWIPRATSSSRPSASPTGRT